MSALNQSSGLDELIGAALQTPWHRLRFPSALEHPFEQDTAAQRLRRFITANLIGTSLFIAFIGSDVVQIPDIFDQALVLRCGVAPLVTLIVLV